MPGKDRRLRSANYTLVQGSSRSPEIYGIHTPVAVTPQRRRALFPTPNARVSADSLGHFSLYLSKRVHLGSVGVVCDFVAFAKQLCAIKLPLVPGATWGQEGQRRRAMRQKKQLPYNRNHSGRRSRRLSRMAFSNSACQEALPHPSRLSATKRCQSSLKP